MLIDKNTVSAENQMIGSSVVSFLGDPGAKKRILIVGNSITRHGPKADIGWDRDWGMAASSPEKDYVHRLFSMLGDRDVFIRIRQSAEWERGLRCDGILDRFDGERDFDADVVVFRLGENVPKDDKHLFEDGLRKFIAHVCPHSKVLFTTCFWENPTVDDAIVKVAAERNEICVDGCFSKDEKNMAIGQFEHSGVAHHPSDEGMLMIAQAIFGQLKNMI